MEGKWIEQIPAMDLFMMCKAVNRNAFCAPPDGVHLRRCRPDEVGAFLEMDLESAESEQAFLDSMRNYFDAVYAPQGNLFYRQCIFACDERDEPIGRCLVWKAYGAVNTIHWYKVKRAHEGRGIGRALLTACMEPLGAKDHPVFLHTHPSCYRAIELYSDFGFSLLTDPTVGHRANDLQACLPILERVMPGLAYGRLTFDRAPQCFLDAAASREMAEF